ncbi:MAG: ABC transporter transmembrane domain-containing protein [Bdellovibrionales bacterium]
MPRKLRQTPLRTHESEKSTEMGLESRQRNLKPLRRVLPFLRPYRLAISAAGLALLISGSTVLALVGGLRIVIDKGLSMRDPSMLDHTLLGLLVAIAVLALSTYARYSLVAWLGEKVVADIRMAMYRRLLALSPDYFERSRSGDILSRLSVDTGLLQSLIGSSISVALRNLVMLTGGLVMMLTTSPKMTGLVMLAVPAVVAPLILFGRKVRKLSRAAQESLADVNVTAEETLHGIRTIQAFSHENLSRLAYDERLEIAVAAANRHIRMRAVLVAMVLFMVFSAIGIVLWIGGHDVLRGAITPGQLSAFVGFSVLTAGAVGALSEVAGELQRAAGAMERIVALLDEKPSIAPPANPVPLQVPRGELAFEHVTYAYPSNPSVPALRDISFSVASGERVAIVGPSGAGKTTLFQLALRFCDPQTGVVRLDGADVRTADPQAVRLRIGLVPQDTVLFSTDAQTNIGFGRPEATQEDIRAAARAAGADTFLSALPHGYATHLGEKGVRLSGGQKQRIAIARAVLRNPSILLLDEATSALDAENEHLVQEALESLMRGRTTLIIAHRLATVRNADRILVLDQGRLVASGTHESLLSEGGLYARLASLQFAAE